MSSLLCDGSGLVPLTGQRTEASLVNFHCTWLVVSTTPDLLIISGRGSPCSHLVRSCQKASWQLKRFFNDSLFLKSVETWGGPYYRRWLGHEGSLFMYTAFSLKASGPDIWSNWLESFMVWSMSSNAMCHKKLKFETNVLNWSLCKFSLVSLLFNCY